MVQNFTRAVLPPTQPYSRINKRGVVWWNDECSKAIRNRKKAYHYSLWLIIQRINEPEASTKCFLKIQKRISYREICSSLYRCTPISEMWHTARLFQSGFPCKPPRSLPKISYTENLTILLNISYMHSSQWRSTQPYTTPGLDNLSYTISQHRPSERSDVLLPLINKFWKF